MIRARAEKAAPDLEKKFKWEEEFRPVRASARDVPDLLALVEIVRGQWENAEADLELIRLGLIEANERCDRYALAGGEALAKFEAVRDAVRPLVVAARNWVHSEGDKDTLEALAEVVDTMSWTVLNDLGIGVEEEDDD